MNGLEIKNLQVNIREEGRSLAVVKEFFLSARKGEITGIIGESGAGKSMSMKAVLGILPENAQMQSSGIWLNGESLDPKTCSGAISWIPQNPAASLDPVFRVEAQMTEAVRAHRKCSRKEAKEYSIFLLRKMGFEEPEKMMRQYPFELSGGMCQRVVTAMALVTQPRLLIADEPTASLDPKTREIILQILEDWVHKEQTAAVIVSHDLATARKRCQKICVMQHGRIVESGETKELFENPVHPYTKLLVGSIQEETDK